MDIKSKQMKRKILITGGAGFIASSLAEKLIADKDNYVVIVDDLSTGFKEKLPQPQDNWCFIKADCNHEGEMSQIMLNFNFDYVFHYAAIVGVQRTQENPVKVIRDIDGFKQIFTLCKNTSVKRVFFASSSEVYGESVKFPQQEYTTPLNSRVPYAVVKNIGETFLRAYHQEFGLDYTIFRFFNTYGPKQSKDFVVSRFIAKAVKNEPITIYGDGHQTRTFCFVDDNIEACLKCFYQDLHINDVVNIGNDNETTILDLARKIIRLTKSSSEIIHLPPLKDGDMTRRCPDISNMCSLLGRKPISIDEGIQSILINPSYIL